MAWRGVGGQGAKACWYMSKGGAGRQTGFVRVAVPTHAPMLIRMSVASSTTRPHPPPVTATAASTHRGGVLLDKFVGELEAGEDLGENLRPHHHLGQVHAVLGNLAQGAAHLEGEGRKRGG